MLWFLNWKGSQWLSNPTLYYHFTEGETEAPGRKRCSGSPTELIRSRAQTPSTPDSAGTLFLQPHCHQRVIACLVCYYYIRDWLSLCCPWTSSSSNPPASAFRIAGTYNHNWLFFWPHLLSLPLWEGPWLVIKPRASCMLGNSTTELYHWVYHWVIPSFIFILI